MAGIIPPSIVTYQYVVDNNFSKYVNVSFPFRVRITDVWFTGDVNLLGGTAPEGTVLSSSFRALALAGVKAKSPKFVLNNFDPPSDWAHFFGSDPEDIGIDGPGAGPEEALKPTIWLGLPDELTAEQLKDSTTQYMGTPFSGAGFRSSTGRPPAKGEATNPYWYNNGWNSEQQEQYKYKTDLGVMNPDEILSLFVYNETGDWTDYNGDGVATIHIAYQGVGSNIEPQDSKTPWSDWYYD